jgi:cyclopropane-fatty-acyl-phospholipid synthase
MFKPLDLMLRHVVQDGNLIVYDAQGTRHSYGSGAHTPLTVRLADRSIERRIALDAQLAVGEAYMQGRLRVESGTIYDVLALVVRNMSRRRWPAWIFWPSVVPSAVRRAARRLDQYNPVTRARRNASHHYDLDGAIYDLFLDPDRQYSCAYFTPGADLAEAQEAKKRHIAAKLALAPGQRVLDIGCGWGGLALTLAKMAECHVTGITLSAEQLKVAQQRAQREGLAGAVRFELDDYRKVEGRFDRVVSVGMFEHVGVNHYGTFFRRIYDLLPDDGVALLHSIGRSDGPGYTNPFMAKYIFPGGYYPALSEVFPAIERSGLIVSDIEILRLHYAETLKAWRERFLANRDKAVALRGERFCRMWEFYLAGAEAAFRYYGLIVFQMQMVKRIGTLPITRDYMFETERRLALSGDRPREPTRLAGE